jgi:hypothetical protein
MKKYIIIILVSWLFPLGTAWAGGIDVRDVIENLNEQLGKTSAASMVLRIKADGEVLETKGVDLSMEMLGKEEVITGNILEPKEDRGTVTIRWEGGKASIRYLKRGHGKERLIVVNPGDAFLGSSLAYVEMKILEDAKNYQYRWLEEGITIEASSQNIGRTVYGKRVLHVKKMEDGFWIIEKIEFYNRRGRLVKTTQNLDFTKYNGWRPERVIVSKEKSEYITELEFVWEPPK